MAEVREGVGSGGVSTTQSNETNNEQQPAGTTMEIAESNGAAGNESTETVVETPVDPASLRQREADPYHTNPVNPEDVAHPTPTEPRVQLEREDNYAQFEDINSLVERIRSGSWEEDDRARIFRERYGRPSILTNFKAWLAGESDVTYNEQTGQVEFHLGTETARRLTNVAINVAQTGALMAAFGLLTGGGAAVALGPSLLGSSIGRAVVEAHQGFSGGERIRREKLIVGRERYYKKALELANRVGPEFPSNWDQMIPEERADYVAERNGAIRSLVNFVYASERNDVVLQANEEGAFYNATDVRGEPHEEGDYGRAEPQQGGPRGPALNTGTEVYQPSDMAPSNRRLDEMEKEFADFRKRYDTMKAVFSLIGGVAGGAFQVLAAQKAEFTKLWGTLQEGGKVRLDIDGNFVWHTVQRAGEGISNMWDGATEYVFHYNNQLESLRAMVKGATIIPGMSENGSHALQATLGQIVEAVNKQAWFEAARTGAAVIGGLVTHRFWKRQNVEGDAKRFAQEREDMVQEHEKLRQRHLPPERIEQINEIARENGKAIPEVGQTWRRQIGVDENDRPIYEYREILSIDERDNRVVIEVEIDNPEEDDLLIDRMPAEDLVERVPGYDDYRCVVRRRRRRQTDEVSETTPPPPPDEPGSDEEGEDAEAGEDNPEDDDGGEDERSRIETEKEELPGTEHTVTIGNFIGNDKSSFICEIAGINRRVDLTGKPSREIYSGEVVKIRIDDNGVNGDQNQVIKAKIIELPEIDSPEDDDSGQEGEEVERVPYVHWGQLLERVHKSGGSVRKIISDSAPEININRVFDLQKHVEKWHVDLSAEEHNELMDLKKKAIIILEKWLSNHQQEASTNDKKQPEAEKPKEQAEKSEDESREEKLRELVKKLLSPGSQWIHSGDPKRSKIKSIDRPEKEIDCAGKVFVLDGINKTDRRWFVEIHQLDQPGDETRLRVEPEKFRQVLMPKSLAEMPDGEEKDQAREILLEEFKKMLDRTPVLNIPDDNDNNGTAVSGEAEAVLPETTEATEESPVDNVGEENNQTGPKTTEEMNQDSSETDTAEGSDQPDSAAPPAELTNGTQENLNTMQQVARTEEENGRKFEQIANVEQLRAGDRIFVRDNTPANVEISTVGGEESRSLVKDFPRKAEFVFNGPAPADFGSGLFEIERKGQKYHLFDTDIIENFEVEHIGEIPADNQEIYPAVQTELNTMRREIDKGIRQRFTDEERAKQPIESFPLPIYDEKGEVIALEPNQVWRIVKEDGSSEDLKIIGITRDNNSGILTIDFENQEPVTGSVKEFQEYFGDSELIEGRKNDL